MDLRLLEIVINDQFAAEVEQLFEKKDISEFWRTCGCNTNIIFKAIIKTEKTEKIMDALEQRYSHMDHFRMVLLPLEASFPSSKEIEDNGKTVETDQTAVEEEKPPLRVSRQELYNDLFSLSRISTFFLTMIILSVIVAAIGLLKNNAAVVIGAMVIAPLLGPNVALSLATTLGDFELGKNALITNFTGLTTGFLMAALIGYFISVDPTIPEIANRTEVGFADIILALASGIAAALSFSSSTASALIGVMVAVALMPPLVASGLLLGAGYPVKSFDAFLLVMINMICINLAGVTTFLLKGIRPFRWWEAKKAKKATMKAILIWTVLLVILFLLIFLKT